MRKLFYILKPVIPRSVQIFLRRMLVKKQLKKYKDTWPILSTSATQPDNWLGWPGGKKFAVILTHDVELQIGHDKCKQLLECEDALGFQSSFNFVPERYEVAKKLRKDIEKRGYEVGVHGLNHDGKLFSSKDYFINRANKINSYLKDWNSVGFRAPAMHHNLEWMHELNINYDLSTFDTDPFEPQADGMGTIFPVWISKNGKNEGYWEFPYTLVQDFTLFVLMKEDNKIWKDKLDWIANNNGMVLVNVHPDYINFSNKENKCEEYSIAQYTDFLQYINLKYKDLFWNPLPKELAKYLTKAYNKTHI